jgi:hypothetical protein
MYFPDGIPVEHGRSQVISKVSRVFMAGHLNNDLRCKSFKYKTIPVSKVFMP